MYKFQRLFSLMVWVSLLISACGTSVSTPDTMMDETVAPEAMMMDETSTPDSMMMHETPTADTMMNKTPEAMMESPAWFSVALTNAQNGTTFTINDFKGKVVLVETMAVWCSNCRNQQNEIKALHEQLGMPDDLISVSLDIDPNENLDILKSYLDVAGFDWLYAVSPAEVSRDIAAEFGDQFLNPPSTPILIVDRHGMAHGLPLGLKSADELMQAVNMYLKEGM